MLYKLHENYVSLDRNSIPNDELDIVVTNLKDNLLEFDFIGPTPIANAIRRILMAEVPSMAIENIFMFDSSGVMHDEVLAHRLGLVPIQADFRMFDYRNNDEAMDNNTLVFGLSVTCTHNPDADPNETLPERKYLHSSVYSRDLVWKPKGDQEARLGSVQVVNGDILLTKLRPGESISLEAHAIKGIGKEHAKWSPVGPASYRLLPNIILREPIVGQDATKFQKCFAKGVVSIVKNKDGIDEAKVTNPRKDTFSREVQRHPEFQNKVLLTRERDHHLFMIDSTGTLPPSELLIEAFNVLIEKCTILREALNDQDTVMH